MAYLSWQFYLFILLLLVFYYCFPKPYRWTVLLAGSIGFYIVIGRFAAFLLIFVTLFGYLSALVLELLFAGGKETTSEMVVRSVFFVFSVVIVLVPITTFRMIACIDGGAWKDSIIAPIGLSFYTLQLLAYLIDVKKRKIKPQSNPFRFLLYMTFFPQIIQGPIPKYEKLSAQLYTGHAFSEELFCIGCYRILWGFFLKLMIADKAGTVADRIFANPARYIGGFVLVGGVMYSIQLYADFLSCVTISRGVSALFGIRLGDNFAQPYFAHSVSDFWRRWHISLSTWLKEYIYIPLGGNRKGKLRQYFNILVTFAVSGLWHGAGWKYFIWGMMHGIYQIVGKLTAPLQKKGYRLCRIGENFRNKLEILFTFFWVMIAWIIFRADSLKTGVRMLRSMVTCFNPWIFFDNSLFHLGLSWKEWIIFWVSCVLLWRVSFYRQKQSVSLWLYRQNVVVRFLICLVLIWMIWIFGTYGHGYSAQEFIYGGF